MFRLIPIHSGKNPKVLTLFLLLILVIILPLTVLFIQKQQQTQQYTAARSSFVTAHGRDLFVNGQRFRSVGVNRYNLLTTGNLGCAGVESNSDIDTFFSQLYQLHATTVRFWFFQSFTGSGTQLAQFDYVLSQADKYGIKVIPVLENHWKACTQGGTKSPGWYASGYNSNYGYPLSLKAYIAKVVPLYKNATAIMAWQIMNEAEDSDATGFINFARDISGYIKSLDPNHLVSLGTVGSGQAPGSQYYRTIHAISTIDLLEYHDYGRDTVAFPSQLAARFSDSIALNKPLFIGEAGILSSAGNRAGLFQAKMDAFFQQGGAAYLIWSYDINIGTHDDYKFSFTDPLAQVVKSVAASI